MKCKFLFAGLLCWTFLSTALIIPVGFALNPLSFLQAEQQEFIYDVEYAVDGHPWLAGWGFESGRTGGQFRIVITSINQTTLLGPNTDTIWTLLYYRNSTSDSWTLIENETNQCFYDAIEYTLSSWAYFVCTNSTTVGLFFSDCNFHWNPGPNGYDGTALQYSGSSTEQVGDLNDRKLVYSFNNQGVLRLYELYNGTGTGWDLFYKVVLNEGDATWIIILIVMFPLIGLGLAALVLYRRREEM